jgi:hypothetical protein
VSQKKKNNSGNLSKIIVGTSVSANWLLAPVYSTHAIVVVQAFPVVNPGLPNARITPQLRPQQWHRGTQIFFHFIKGPHQLIQAPFLPAMF